jgi:DNA end-binding protein Ku
MPARAIASGTICFGLVSIPVKLYTATSSEHVSFNMLDKKSGARVRQQYVSSATGEVVEREDIVKGYEYARGQYVQVTEEEIKALEAERSGSVDIVEFVPLGSVDLVQAEKSYYLGPDRGGDKAYRLLASAMRKKDLVSVGRWAARGKEQLVLIRPYREGLILHQMFYATEVRAFDEVDLGAKIELAEVEMELALKLIDQLTCPAFQPDKYADRYTERVRALIDKKVAGQEITVAPEQPRAQIIDLFEALKQSLHQAQGGKLAAAGEEAPASDALAPKPVKKALPRGKAARVRKSSAG